MYVSSLPQDRVLHTYQKADVALFNIVHSVVVESIVVAVTWINTLSIIRLTREASSRNHKGVSYLVLRDGKFRVC